MIFPYTLISSSVLMTTKSKIESAKMDVDKTRNNRFKFCFKTDFDKMIMTPKQWKSYLVRLKETEKAIGNLLALMVCNRRS